jgi:hypothetical protein
MGERHRLRATVVPLATRPQNKRPQGIPFPQVRHRALGPVAGSQKLKKLVGEGRKLKVYGGASRQPSELGQCTSLRGCVHAIPSRRDEHGLVAVMELFLDGHGLVLGTERLGQLPGDE